MILVRFVVYSNILISISAGLLCYAFCEILHIDISHWYGLFVFSSTLFTYNFQRILKHSAKQFEASVRIVWIEKHIGFLRILSGLSLALSTVIYFLYLFKVETVVLLVFLGVISVLYAYKFLGKKKMNLRDIPTLKIHWICLVWVGACAVFPVLNELIFHKTYMFLFVGLYLYILAITIPFDIRDFALDITEQRTIPQVIGVKWAKLLAAGLLIFSALFFFLFYPFLIYHPMFHLAMVTQFGLILLSNPNRSELFFSGAIDGAILFLALAFLL